MLKYENGCQQKRIATTNIEVVFRLWCSLSRPFFIYSRLFSWWQATIVAKLRPMISGNAINEDVKQTCDQQREYKIYERPKCGVNLCVWCHMVSYMLPQISALHFYLATQWWEEETIQCSKPRQGGRLLPLSSWSRRDRARGSRMVLYRFTLMAKSVKTELGTVMRYTVSQVMHKAFQCFHSPCRKRASTSNSASRVTVRRSEMARDNSKRFVGLSRSSLLASMA